MPLKVQASPTVVIQPCYDGRAVPITHQLAAEGLALLSIKGSHHDCSVVRNPGSRLSTLSCTQGIKPRNSFWNLHKPELRKVKGLDCARTDNVIELFENHNTESSGVKSYGKKVVSKLSSIMTKKTKSATQPQIILPNIPWPTKCCVLSSICQEKEVISSELQKIKETEMTIPRYNIDESNTVTVDREVADDTVFLTHPQSIMNENTSDDLIPVGELLNPSNGDSSTNTTPTFTTGTSQGYDGAAVCSPEISSSILLENKPSQHQISIPSNAEFCKERTMEEACAVFNESGNLSINNENSIDEKKEPSSNSEKEHKIIKDSPSSVAVQSIFSDIFQDIEDIKNVINSYMSSFCVQEEEHNNFPNAYTSSKEVASHFLEQTHGTSPKDKNCNPKNVHSTFCHNFQENSGDDNILEQCHIEKDTKVSISAYDSRDQLGNDLQEGAVHKQTTNETGKEMSSNYCYWEDGDILSEFISGNVSENLEHSRGPEQNQNTSLVTLNFIENMWEEFISRVETHALFVDLLHENEMKKLDHELNFPSYGHWSNMYDPNIFQEAENIVYTLDNLFAGMCFPEDYSQNYSAYIPCTIVEILDERESASGFEQGSNEIIFNRDGRISTEQEYQAVPLENEGDSTADMRKHFGFDDCSADEIIKINNNYEFKLEPVFTEEKLVLHEIEYSTVPEYEKIQLHPIRHAGRVDFSILQSYSDLKTVERKEYDENKQTCKHDTPVGCNKISPSDRFSLRDNPTSQSTSENKDDEEFLMNKLRGDDSDIGLSVFAKFQDKNDTENSNQAFLFSSPTVQLNLTSPFVNNNKK